MEVHGGEENGGENEGEPSTKFCFEGGVEHAAECDFFPERGDEYSVDNEVDALAGALVGEDLFDGGLERIILREFVEDDVRN